MTLPFVKLVGAGNDFIFVKQSDLPENCDRSALAADVCHRHFGVGADGFAVIAQKGSSFAWDFFNSDGSPAEMCGNAARCAVRFIADSFAVENCEIETRVGIVCGRILDPLISVQWPIESTATKKMIVDLENFKSVAGFFINTGVPHFVIVENLQELTKEDCLAIQSHPHFGKAQTNVTFLSTDEDGNHSTKTFERGVRDFTLACGTGVIASACVLQEKDAADAYELSAPGGLLQVKLDGKDVTLIGPARMVCTGEYNRVKD